jgi:hypothetical protein
MGFYDAVCVMRVLLVNICQCGLPGLRESTVGVGEYRISYVSGSIYVSHER